jgi:DNA-binding transcriptional LysR family regulator
VQRFTGRIDLLISAARQLGPEIRVQPLFTTRFVGMAREDHPIFAQDITPEKLTHWGHISISRRGKDSGPIDRVLGESGLQRQVSLIVATPYSAIFALLDSDLLLPMPEHLARSALAAGLRVRLFELPIPLETVPLTQAWHPRFQQDAAHRWLRQTIRQLCSEDE